MSHVRTQIRAAAGELIRARGAFARVEAWRARPAAVEDLPQACLYDGAETAEETQLLVPAVINASAELHVEVRVAAVAPDFAAIDAALDAACAEVQKALGGNILSSTLGGLAAGGVRYDGASAPELSSEGDTPFAARVLTFTVGYLYREDDPETALQNLPAA